MRSADHAGLRVGEQDRAAVRGGHADRKACNFSHDRISVRRGLTCPGRFGNDHIRRMNLIAADEMVRRDAQ